MHQRAPFFQNFLMGLPPPPPAGTSTCGFAAPRFPYARNCPAKNKYVLPKIISGRTFVWPRAKTFGLHCSDDSVIGESQRLSQSMAMSTSSVMSVISNHRHSARVDSGLS